MVSFSEFQKLELRVGTVRAAERVPNSEKLVKLSVGLGSTARTSADSTQINAESVPNQPLDATRDGTRQTQTAAEKRQIIAGVGKAYAPEELVGKQIIIVANLEPRILMGLESQGMLLAATDPEGNPVLLIPEKEVPSGSEVR